MIKTDKLYYKLYVEDINSSERYANMTPEEVGAFRKFLDWQWSIGGPVPYEPDLFKGFTGWQIRPCKRLMARLLELGKIVFYKGSNSTVHNPRMTEYQEATFKKLSGKFGETLPKTSAKLSEKPNEINGRKSLNKYNINKYNNKLTTTELEREKQNTQKPPPSSSDLDWKIEGMVNVSSVVKYLHSRSMGLQTENQLLDNLKLLASQIGGNRVQAAVVEMQENNNQRLATIQDPIAFLRGIDKNRLNGGSKSDTEFEQVVNEGPLNFTEANAYIRKLLN